MWSSTWAVYGRAKLFSLFKDMNMEKVKQVSFNKWCTFKQLFIKCDNGFQRAELNSKLFEPQSYVCQMSVHTLKQVFRGFKAVLLLNSSYMQNQVVWNNFFIYQLIQVFCLEICSTVHGTLDKGSQQILELLSTGF